MAELTSTLTYANLQAEVGFFLGFGDASADWTSSGTNDQTSRINRVIDAGLRSFYNPGLVEGMGNRPHEWSFLRPPTTIIIWPTITGTLDGNAVTFSSPDSTVTATTAKFHPSVVGRTFKFDTSANEFTIASFTSTTVILITGDASGEAVSQKFTITDSGDYELPIDHAGIDGDLNFAADDFKAPLRMVPEQEILRNRARNNSSGTPEVFSQGVSAGVHGILNQRLQIRLWPLTDTQRTMSYNYRVGTDKLSGSQYPLGGALHAEAIRASCLAKADLMEKDNIGVQQANYLQQLQASIALDQRNASPDWIGNLNDGGITPGFRRRHTTTNTVTYSP